MFDFFVSPMQTAKKAATGLADFFKDGLVPAFNKATKAVSDFNRETKEMAKQAERDAEKKSYLRQYIRDAEVAAAKAEALAEKSRKFRDFGFRCRANTSTILKRTTFWVFYAKRKTISSHWTIRPKRP